MQNYWVNQGYIFLIFIANGILIGIVFDVFRALRKCIKTNSIITNLEDVFFLIISGIIIIFSIYKYNYGQIRIYIFVSFLLGIMLYFKTLSKYFIKIDTVVINFLIKLIKIIIIKNLKLIYFKLIKPIIAFFYNICKKNYKKNNKIVAN